MRIVWTNEEKRALHECMVDLCYSTPSYSSKALLRHAQEEVIPYERRSIISDQRVFNYKTMITSARAKAEEHRKKAAKLPPAPSVAPLPLPEPPAKKLDTLGEVFELFIDALADRILAKIEDKQIGRYVTQDELDKSFDSLYPTESGTQSARIPASKPSVMLEKGWLDEHLEKLTIRSKAAKVKRPTSLIVGLNGHQMECVKQSRPEIDFTFVTAEQAVSMSAFNKEHTILMTKFINHSVQTKYRKHPNLHYCNGGISDLKHLLRIIFYKEAV